ncbi:MAG: hypothetical protein EOL87_13975 [Spartobacteria bacterium]|nr:hypothetical protein [Spartobacteria bacterium]
MRDYRPFQGYHEHGDMQNYRRHLPHWRQKGATYFVTFRLADSIPWHVLEQWKEERIVWNRAWGLNDELSEQEYRARYSEIPETIRKVHERDLIRKPLQILDHGYGDCIFRFEEHRKSLQQALHYYDLNKIQCGDFVVMPNHVHWIVMPTGAYKLERVLQSVKSYVSTELGKHNAEYKGKLWQKESYDRCIRDREELTRIRTYIKQNPVHAHLKAGEYAYYRADWLDLVAGG